jgi:hypothetical protein
MPMRYFMTLLCALVAQPALAEVPAATRSTEGAELYFITPQHGELVSGEVHVRFGLRGMGVAPAGINLEGTGHHHLLIDVENLPPVDQPIPADAQHVHFGKGQTETTLKLAPGSHTLQLLLGDYLHRPHQPVVVSEKISIKVAD